MTTSTRRHRRRPDVQPCGERHAPYLHCLTCNPPPAENPDRLQGPELGARRLYRGRVVVVSARSYVWAPGDPAYHGGARRYDWSVIANEDGSRSLVVDDTDLEPLP